MIKSIIIRAIKRNIRNTVRNIKYTDFQSIKTVIITYEFDDFEKAVAVKSIFEKQGINTFLFGYSVQKEYTLQAEHEYVFSSKLTNLFYFPKVEVVNYFTQILEKSDVLIDISINNNLSLSYLISKQKQILKVGIQKKEFNLYDVMIDVEKNVESKFLCEHILFYLRKLKGKA